MNADPQFSPALECPRCGKRVFIETGDFYKCLGCRYRCRVSEDAPWWLMIPIPLLLLMLLF